MNEPALNQFFATPAIFLPGMNEAEWQYQIDLMLCRSALISEFLKGNLTPDQFENALHELGVDVISIASDWEDGISHF